jgi:hypothetical protein
MRRKVTVRNNRARFGNEITALREVCKAEEIDGQT